MRNVLMNGVVVLLLAGTAQAATLGLRQESCPVAGMSRYVVSVDSGSTKVVSYISDLTITGPVHQVWDAAALGGAPSPQIDSLLSRPADWYDADTCLLIVDDSLGDNGVWTETNDGSLGGSGLSLFADTFPPTTGMGAYGHSGPTSEGLDPAHQSPVVDFMQVVIPTDAVVYMDVTIGLGMVLFPSDEPSFHDYPIPEPATLSLLAVGGAVLVRRRRR